MAKNRYGFDDREGATADLRAAFAALYNELRRRGHDVLVRYDDPADPLYIPRIVEVDGLRPDRLNVRFFVEPFVEDEDYVRGLYFGVLYIPTNTARQQYSMTQKKRTQAHSKNQLTGAALADWFERLLDVEKRAKDWEARKGW